MPETDHRDFSLQQFPGDLPLLSLKISGYIYRRGRRLGLSYNLDGCLEEVLLPGPAPRPERRDGLWEETCCEFFLAPRDGPGYWEFNLSPAGHWNAYRFPAYRQGLTEEKALAALPFAVQARAGCWRLDLELDLAGIIKADQTLEAAVAAVIRLKTGEAAHYALTHPATRADFHHRAGFLISL